MVSMFETAYGNYVKSWPIGIDTDIWRPALETSEPEIDVLIYDKILWNREIRVPELLDPICYYLDKSCLSYKVIRYGTYRPDDYRSLLHKSRLMVFLCEHETQGLAYQEALSCPQSLH